MRAIIAPAKQMRVATDSIPATQLPVFLQKTQQLQRWIASLSFDQQKRLWACNDALAQQNTERFAHMDVHANLSPALLSYNGIQYTYMAPCALTDSQLAYVQDHLRILSGFYGVLKPLDGVVPYRLEMQAKAALDGCKNLYDFWGRLLYDEVVDDSRVIINLASKEYSQCIKAYTTPQDTFITCVFAELSGTKVVQKGVYAKMARGEMVRYMAQIHAETPEQLKAFNWSGYQFCEERSDDTQYVFLKAREQ